MSPHSVLDKNNFPVIEKEERLILCSQRSRSINNIFLFGSLFILNQSFANRFIASQPCYPHIDVIDNSWSFSCQFSNIPYSPLIRALCFYFSFYKKKDKDIKSSISGELCWNCVCSPFWPHIEAQFVLSFHIYRKEKSSSFEREKKVQ